MFQIRIIDELEIPTNIGTGKYEIPHDKSTVAIDDDHETKTFMSNSQTQKVAPVKEGQGEKVPLLSRLLESISSLSLGQQSGIFIVFVETCFIFQDIAY